jgi:hypothetical protein
MAVPTGADVAGSLRRRVAFVIVVSVGLDDSRRPCLGWQVTSVALVGYGTIQKDEGRRKTMMN